MTPDEVAEPYADLVAEGITRIREDGTKTFHAWLCESMRFLAVVNGRPGGVPTEADWVGVVSLALAAARDDVPFERAVAWVWGGNTDPRVAGELDEVAIERAMYGDPVDLTHAERLEAVRRMDALPGGRTARQIAEALRTTTRTVQRHRAELRSRRDAA